MSVNTQAIPADVVGASTDVKRAVWAASARSGVKFSYLMAQASIESGYRPDAKSPTSSATGLYQFIKSTWLDMVRNHGAKYGLADHAKALENGTADGKLQNEILKLRNDPKLSAAMAAEYAKSNKQHLEKTVGGTIGDTDLYLAHFLGPSGAERFLKGMRANSAKPAADAFPDAAHANRPIFYDKGRARSYAEVRQIFAAKIDGSTATAMAAPPSPPPPRVTFTPDFSNGGNGLATLKLMPAGMSAPKLAPATELLLINLKEETAPNQRQSSPLF